MEQQWVKVPESVLPKQLRLDDLTDKQKKLLEEFKDSNKNQIKPNTHDLDLATWLIARNWDLKLASEMFQNSMKWRASVGADTILEDFPKSPYFQFLTSKYPSNHSDPACPKVLRCKDGTHFCIERMGSLNPEVVPHIPSAEIIRYHIWTMELANKVRHDIFAELGSQELQQSTCVEDLAGLGMAQLAMVDTLKAFTSIDNANYPETLRKVVIVNVPTIFSMIWKAVQYLWDAKQVAKFQFISAGADYASVLKQIATLDNIPKEYSGELDYALPSALPLDSMVKELNQIQYKKFVVDTVPRSDILEKEFKVETGQVLHFEFKTIDHDIGFMVKFKATQEKEPVEISGYQRLNSHSVAHFGRHSAAKTGSFILHWDNAYSWTRSKELHYHVLIE